MSMMPDSRSFDIGNATMVTLHFENGRLGLGISPDDNDDTNPAFGFIIAAGLGLAFWCMVVLGYWYL